MGRHTVRQAGMGWAYPKTNGLYPSLMSVSRVSHSMAVAAPRISLHLAQQGRMLNIQYPRSGCILSSLRQPLSLSAMAHAYTDPQTMSSSAPGRCACARFSLQTMASALPKTTPHVQGLYGSSLPVAFCQRRSSTASASARPPSAVRSSSRLPILRMLISPMPCTTPTHRMWTQQNRTCTDISNYVHAPPQQTRRFSGPHPRDAWRPDCLLYGQSRHAQR